MTLFIVFHFEFLQVMVTGINATWVDHGTSMQDHRER